MDIGNLDKLYVLKNEVDKVEFSSSEGYNLVMGLNSGLLKS